MQHFKSLQYTIRTYFFKYTTLQEMLKAYIFFFNTFIISDKLFLSFQLGFLSHSFLLIFCKFGSRL